MQQVKLIFKIELFLLLIFFNEYLVAGSVEENRKNRLRSHRIITEVQGVKPKNVIKASNGNIYIKNARVYTGSKESPDGKVSVKTGSNTRKVIIKNVKIHSRNNSSSSNKSNNAVLSIETNGNTQIVVKDSKVKSHNIVLDSASNAKNVCAGALCIQADRKSDILVDNVEITTNSTDISIQSNTNSGKKCAGALCIQTEGSEVNVVDSAITSYGHNDIEIRN